MAVFKCASLPIASIVLVITLLFSNNSMSAEFCVGAKGSQKLGYCRYEYEAFYYTGTCRARNGLWDKNYVIKLHIRDPSHLEHHEPPRREHSRFRDDTTGICKRACAFASAEGPRGRFTKSVCNRRAHE